MSRAVAMRAGTNRAIALRIGAMLVRWSLRSALVLLACLQAPGAGVFAAGSMTAIDVARSLGDLRDGARQNAIASLARGGQIAAPLSGADGAAILLGATHGSRAGAIAELAAIFKADLSGQEAAAILGPEDVLTDGNRSNAIAALARARRFGPSVGEDAALALKGATHSSRAAAIAELAPYLRAGISGSAIAAVVGPASAIADGNRSNAIAAIARTAKQIAVLSGADGAAILLGAGHSSRAAAIAELAPLFKTDLSGQEAAAILGPEDVLADGNRSNAIAALARSKRFGPSIGEDAALALKGATHSSRAAAIAEIAPYLRAGMTGSGIAAVVGPASAITDGNRSNAIAAIARMTKQIAVLSGADGSAILLGATNSSRASAIGELAALFKADLSGQEAAAILGPEEVLADGNRSNAIAALARAKRFGPSIGEDAAFALKGATHSSRAAAIAEMAPYLRNEMSGKAIAVILGDPLVLSEGNRYNAINALANAGKLPAGLSADEVVLIVQGMTGQTRVGAMALIANAAKQRDVATPLPIGGAPFPSPTAGTTPTSIGSAPRLPSPGIAASAPAAPNSNQQPGTTAPADLASVASQIAKEIAERAVASGVGEIKQSLVADFIVTLAKRLPADVARQLTLNPRGVVGWSARITSKELASDIAKVDPLGFAIGVALEAIVDFLRSDLPNNTTLQNYEIEALVLLTRETGVLVAAGRFGMHASIAAQSIVSATTLIEASQAVYEVAWANLTQPQRDAQALVAADFLSLRAAFKAATTPTRKLQNLTRLNTYLAGDGRSILSGFSDPNLQRRAYICSLARAAQLQVDCTKL